MFDDHHFDPKPVPPCRPYTGCDELDRLLTPARHFDRPRDVLRDTALSLAEKRAILSSWASETCAAAAQPDLRNAFDRKPPVPFEEIVDTLQRLDSLTDAALQRPSERRKDGGSHSPSA